jgi:uncharacterized membrane protein
MRTFSFRPALELRGRRFKGVRGFAGKPFHPPLTDMTVGAYTIAPLLEIVSYLFKGSAWAAEVHKAAAIVLLVGAITSLATVATGFADWLTTQKGTQMRRMANAHAWTMVVMTVVVVVNLIYKFLASDGANYGDPDVLGALLSLVILVLVTIGGTVGGSLTYDFGFNVETATDNHVYHVSEHDIIHPHDEPPAS